MCVCVGGGILFWGNQQLHLWPKKIFQIISATEGDQRTNNKNNAFILFIFLLGEGYNFFLSHSPNEDIWDVSEQLMQTKKKNKFIHYVCRLPNHIPNIITNKDLVLVCHPREKTKQEKKNTHTHSMLPLLNESEEKKKWTFEELSFCLIKLAMSFFVFF